MHEDLNWAIGGEAGDGIDSTGKIFARALSRAGRHVYTSKDFASRIRGGYTAYKIRTAVDPVESVVDRLDVLIALTERTIDENLAELHEGSVIIYDGEQATMGDVEIPAGMIGLDVPLQSLAEEAGGAIMRNVVALGVACAVTEFPIANLDEALEKRFGDKGRAIVENNREAARLGQEYVRENYDYDFEYDLETTDSDYVLLNGDEAIGMGAIAAGCRFYAGYPITPATDIMEYLTGRIEQFGGTVVQAEDELAAINMALGAARAGARAMTGTSGPGIDLMSETFGLIATTETPLVIANVMRSGPSTGMPTKQGQEDLNMMLYGGHGEIPRFVLAPTSIAECFHKTIEAFNLAEKYQVPVYLTADLSLAVTERTYEPGEFDMDAVEIDRGKVVDEDEVGKWLDEQGRFVYTNDALVGMVGYDEDEVLDNTPSLIKDEGSVEAAESELGRLLSDEGPDSATFEVEIQPKSGEGILCEDHMGVLPYEGDEFEGSAGVLRDISDREERLERYREYTDSILDASDDLFFVCDEEGSLQRWNERLNKVTGYSDEEVASMNAVSFVPEEHRERLEERMAEVFENGSARIEVPVLTEEGSAVPYEFTANRAEHPDGDPRLVGIGRDRTNRKELKG